MLFYDSLGREIFVSTERCPLCYSNLYMYNNPKDDLAEHIWCINDDCIYFKNQYMSFEEIYPEYLFLTDDETTNDNK